MGRIRKSIQENVASDDIVRKLSDTEFVLCAKEDTELMLGRIKVETGYTINAGRKGIITSLTDNICKGLKVNDNVRLISSEVIPCIVTGQEIAVFIKVNDDTLYSHMTNYGTRTSRYFIPKGAPVAMLTIL